MFLGVGEMPIRQEARTSDSAVPRVEPTQKLRHLSIARPKMGIIMVRKGTINGVETAISGR